MLGTALVDNLLGLIVVAVLVAYFYVCGIIEERNLTATFPTAYPQYKSTTEMLIPFGTRGRRHTAARHAHT
jgi:protein-S-isoprenylcysteine O-methyltransferase Ste14